MTVAINSLVWIRRDLRLHDHTALSSALAEPGAVQPVFIFDSDILERFQNPDDARLSFIAEAVCQLERDIAAKGGTLLVFYGRAEEIIPTLARALQVSSVYAGEDFEPATILRDNKVQADLAKSGILFVRDNDHLLISPHDIIKKDDTPYSVFTPYSTIWKKMLNELHTAERLVVDSGRYAPPEQLTFMLRNEKLRQLDPSSGPGILLLPIGYNYAAHPIWKASEGRQWLADFVAHKLEHYHEARDMLAAEGTSRLSPYLRFGLLSVRECYRMVAGKPGAEAWIRELIWRDFYAMVLFYCPISAKQEFQKKYRGILKWQQDLELLKIFKAGMTGYPVIDAAMRQLKAEGWMHNRARMIVASFLTKDLMTCWTLGEEYFAQTLMDYELASNVGGWQWAASTGTDPQPYFRIFNPVLQGKKFDPEGEYIRKYVPELRHLASKYIHEPHRYKDKVGRLDYPEPMVDHETVRNKVLAFFKNLEK